MDHHDKHLLDMFCYGTLPASATLRLLHDPELLSLPGGLRAVPNYERGIKQPLPPEIYMSRSLSWTVPVSVTSLKTG